MARTARASGRQTGASLTGALIRLAAALALLWLGGLVWFALTLPRAAALTTATDGVVVLTGGPGRLARGIEVLQHGSAKRLLISGVGPRIDKAELAAAVEAPRALFGKQVDLGLTATDTRSNATETAAWLARHHYNSVRLVTSTVHMRRAVQEFRTRLPASVTLLPDAVPVDTGAESVGREYSKYLVRSAALVFGR